jgi:pimeloyl-ACP methyl ester carboxylesterase
VRFVRFSSRISRRGVGGIALSLALAGVLAGCSTGSIPDGGEKPIAQLRIPMNSDLESYYDQGLEWESCEKGYRCAAVNAPLDWEHPDRSISLALIEHRATGKRLGSLLVNPGGPGESGVNLVGGDVDDAVTPAVARHYDVIGFDPRGVGYSTAVKCGGARGLDGLLYSTVPGAIGSKSWIAGQLAKSRAFAKACEHGTGALLAHVDTVTAARDLDLLRAVLGDKKLNYLGYSYGAYLGTVYAGLYPKNVGRMVFDGPENPWSGGGSVNGSGADDATVDQAAAFEGDLNTFLARCLRGDKAATGKGTCPFTGSLTDAQAAVSAMLAAAASHPLHGRDGRELNAATLATAIDQPLYDPSTWPDLASALTKVGKSDASGAFELADEYNERGSDGKYDDNFNEASFAINCLEYGPSYDLKFDARELTELRKAAPILGAYEAYGDLECAGWPYGPTTFPEPIHAPGAAPILLVATTGDPATPYAAAKELGRQLDSGHLVTFHGEGHTAYDLGHACVDHAVDEFLDDGIVPKADPQCS